MKKPSFKRSKEKEVHQDAQRQRTGVTSSQHRVPSYYTATRRQIDTFERQYATTASIEGSKRRLQFKSVWITALTVLLITIALFALLTISPNGASVTIQNGPAYRTAQEYDAIISDALHGDVRNLFKPTLQGDAVSTELMKQIPEATSINIYAPLLGRRAEVIITTSAPFAVLLQSNDPSYIINNRGKVVINTQKSTIDTSTLSTVTNTSGITYKEIDQIFKPDEMLSMQELQFQYAQGKDGVAVAYILPQLPREIHTQEGAYIAKFSIDSGVSMTQQFGALRAVQGQLAVQGKSPLEYIDVRLGDKVFIK